MSLKLCAVLTGAALLLSGCGRGDPAPSSEETSSLPVSAVAGCPSGGLPGVFDRRLPRNGRHDADLLGQAVLNETNRARCGNGLEPLRGDGALQQAAALHSRDMARLDFFSHDSPVPGRETVGDRAKQVGFRYQSVAENIIEARYMAYESRRKYEVINPERCAFAYADGTPIARHTYASLAREVVSRWMESPGHRRNILNRTHRAHGFAIAPNGVQSLCGGLFGAQVMGR